MCPKVNRNLIGCQLGLLKERPVDPAQVDSVSMDRMIAQGVRLRRRTGKTSGGFRDHRRIALNDGI
jgi:hypothetical protein